MSNTDVVSKQDSLLRDAKVVLRQGDLEQAALILGELLEEHPAHREALYYLAVCQRKKLDYASALESLQRLIAHHPNYGRAYQEQGHNYLSLQRAEEAADAFATAVELNPALIASWKALVHHFRNKGPKSKAQQAAQYAQWLSSLPGELLTANSLIHEEQLFVAERLVRQYLQANVDHPEAMRLLAEIATELQILDDAEILLENCVEKYPDFNRARREYIQVLHKRQKYDRALEQANVLYSLEPDNVGYELTLASEEQAVGNFDTALRMYQRIIDSGAGIARVFSAQGHALKTVGRTQEAVEAYQLAYKAAPEFGDAYWSLANLKTYQFSANELTQMRQQEASQGLSVDDHSHLCFALAKALEDRQEYPESFSFYFRGNELKRGQSDYRAEKLEREFQIHSELCTSEFFQQRKDWGANSAEPIFIVGLPRAGSTLLEQILASHSQVDATMELANIIGLAHRLQGRQSKQEKMRYPAVLGELSAKHCAHFGTQYIEDTRFHRQGGAFFIDKMPNNFRHIGLIQLILPNAKIIDARREPMACCFSGFKQLFAEGQEFSYSLESIGRYYRSYVELMAHWDAVLPNKILRVQHEELVADLEGQVRRILDYCQLPFEQQCVDFHETDRAVRTPSSEQVRQPIYQSGLQQWKNYAEYLQPLEQALGPALKAYR